MVYMHIYLYLPWVYTPRSGIVVSESVFLSFINISRFPNNSNPIKFNYYIFKSIISISCILLNTLIGVILKPYLQIPESDSSSCLFLLTFCFLILCLISWHAGNQGLNARSCYDIIYFQSRFTLSLSENQRRSRFYLSSGTKIIIDQITDFIRSGLNWKIITCTMVCDLWQTIPMFDSPVL